MNYNREQQDFLIRQTLTRDPVSTARMLIVGRMLLVLFLIAGLLVLGHVTYTCFFGADAGKPLSRKLYFIGFAIGWNFLVIQMWQLNSSMLKGARQMIKQIEAEQQGVGKE